MRVLFVDDDANVLSGLRRMLRGMRFEWDMQFAASGEEAIALLRSKAFDVLISDMRMPGVDGLQLLRMARDERPSVVRIVLTGHTEDAAAMLSVPLAHQVLNKPCDAETLVETVRDACDLGSRLANERLRGILGGIETLPSPPATTLALSRALAADDDVTIEMVADVVMQDPAISAKLLQLVNSAFFGLARNVTTVRAAVAYLGINVVRNLVTALDSMAMFERAEVRDTAFLAMHYAHSHEVAYVAGDLVDRSISHEVFGIALLHDIGLLVVARHMPAELAGIEDAIFDGAQRTDAEREFIGATHAQVGAYLLALWGLPHLITDAVARHHERPPGHTMNPAHATFIAEALVSETGASGPWREDTAALDDEYLQSLGVTDAIARVRGPRAELPAPS